MASKPDFLSKVPLFREFDAVDLRRFADATRMRSFARGDDLFTVGEPGSSLYIIIKGNVQILQPGPDGELQLALLGPGDCIGEMAILNAMPQSATARALDDVDTLALDKADFRELVHATPAVGLKLLEILSAR